VTFTISAKNAAQKFNEIAANGSTTTAGNITVYTCPAGKNAVIFGGAVTLDDYGGTANEVRVRYNQSKVFVFVKTVFPLPAELPHTANMPQGFITAGQTVAITLNLDGGDTDYDWGFRIQELPV